MNLRNAHNNLLGWAQLAIKTHNEGNADGLQEAIRVLQTSVEYVEAALAREPQPQWLVILGNPVRGFAYYGPFPDVDAAGIFIEGFGDEMEGWYTQLSTNPPPRFHVVVDNSVATNPEENPQ